MIEQWGNLRIDIKNGSSADARLIAPEAMRMMQQVRTEMSLSQFKQDTHSKFGYLFDGTFVKASSCFGQENVLIILPEKNEIIKYAESLPFAVCVRKPGAFFQDLGYGNSWLSLYEFPYMSYFYDAQARTVWNDNPWENENACGFCPTNYDARLRVSEMMIPQSLDWKNYEEEHDYKEFVEVFSTGVGPGLDGESTFGYSWKYKDKITLKIFWVTNSHILRDLGIMNSPYEYTTDFYISINGITKLIGSYYHMLDFPLDLSAPYTNIVASRGLIFAHPTCGIYRAGSVFTFCFFVDDFGNQLVYDQTPSPINSYLLYAYVLGVGKDYHLFQFKADQLVAPLGDTYYTPLGRLVLNKHSITRTRKY